MGAMQVPSSRISALLYAFLERRPSKEGRNDHFLMIGPWAQDSLGDWFKYWAIDFVTLIGKATSRDLINRWIKANRSRIGGKRSPNRLFDRYVHEHRGKYIVNGNFFHFFLKVQ